MSIKTTSCKECISFALCNARMRDNIRDSYENTPEVHKRVSHTDLVVIAYQQELSTCPIFIDHIIALHESRFENGKAPTIKESLIIKCLYKAFNVKMEDMR